ncbi:MAG: sugar ABC transporter permease, partial [Casimicrobiaceae bacterium]
MSVWALSRAVARPRPFGGRQALIEKITGMGFSLPATILLLLTCLVPLCVLCVMSFTDYELGNVGVKYVGLANFSKAMGDPVFRRSLWNTLLYVAIVLPGSVCLGLLVAITIYGRKRTRSFYEIVYFLPVTSTLIAMATVWQFL